MKEFVISEVKAETAILVGLITKDQDEEKTTEYLDELEFLADTAGAVTVKRFTQKVNGPNTVTYVGKGKLEEIKQYIEDEEDNYREIGMVIFDDELSAKQMRNIVTCCLVCSASGPTLSVRVVALVRAVAREAWDCAALVRPSSRWTAVSSCSASRCSSRDCWK